MQKPIQIVWLCWIVILHIIIIQFLYPLSHSASLIPTMVQNLGGNHTIYRCVLAFRLLTLLPCIFCWLELTAYPKEAGKYKGPCGYWWAWPVLLLAFSSELNNTIVSKVIVPLYNFTTIYVSCCIFNLWQKKF